MKIYLCYNENAYTYNRCNKCIRERKMIIEHYISSCDTLEHEKMQMKTNEYTNEVKDLQIQHIFIYYSISKIFLNQITNK